MKKKTALEAFYDGVPFEKVCEDYNLKPSSLRQLVKLFPPVPDLEDVPVYAEFEDSKFLSVEEAKALGKKPGAFKERRINDTERAIVQIVNHLGGKTRCWVLRKHVRMYGWYEDEEKGLMVNEFDMLIKRGYLEKQGQSVKITDAGMALLKREGA